MPNQIPNLTENISSAVTPQGILNGYNGIFYEIEQGIGADVATLRELVAKGIITQKQGQYLMAKLAKKTFELNNYKKSLNAQQITDKNSEQTQTPDEEIAQEDALSLFMKENPNFFDTDARNEVCNYLKECNMDKDEISKISQLIEKLESSAVDKYLKNISYEKSLNDENALAKSKMNTYAQNATCAGKNNRIYTRKEIGDMSGDEFTRNEKMIMEQLKQGLIK